MTIPETDHPEFKSALVGEIADSLLRLLRGNDELSDYMTEINAYEIEEFITAADSIKSPALGVILDAFDRRREASNRQGALDTGLELAFVFPVLSSRGTQTWLQARVVEHTIRLIEAQKGVLLDEDDQPLTEALLVVQRVPQSTKLLSTKAAVVKRLRLLFHSSIHVETGEFI